MVSKSRKNGVISLVALLAKLLITDWENAGGDPYLLVQWDWVKMQLMFIA